MLKFGLGLLSALLLVLTFPRYGFAWLAPFALAPLLVALAREQRPGRRFLMGEAAGIVYWFGVCYWIQFVLEVHGRMGRWGSWGAFALFCLAKALHLGVFSLLAGPLLRQAYALPAVGALWVGIERTHGSLGFAWLALGNAGADMSVPMRLAPYTGVYGLSFVFVLMSAAMALVGLRRPRSHLAWLLVLPALYLLPRLPAVERPEPLAIVLQPDIDQRDSWPEREVIQLQDRLATLTLTAALEPRTKRPQIIVWPEVPAPLYYYDDPRFQEQARELARLAEAPFLFGTVAYTAAGAPLNSALLLSAGGQPLSRYDKMFLVPFGEFVPPLFGFVHRITKEAGDFQPGRSVVVSVVHGRQLGSFICYEAAFPHLVRRFARSGAEVLFNLSNDGYFGDTNARPQHLLIARMRAAENRRWIIRATNDGITAAIDPAGRIPQWLPEHQQRTARFRFDWIREITFYARYGDWFAWLCLVTGVAAALAPAVLSSRSPSTPSPAGTGPRSTANSGRGTAARLALRRVPPKSG